jgi:predicted nuclease of predicted toxin-antitoxin system
MHFLLDANMPRRAIDAVRAAGHECTHVRDTTLGNAPDELIAAHALQHGLTLVTRDFDFADTRAYPPETYSGIVVLIVPKPPEGSRPC